jgi:hypothetical protein
MKVDQAVDSGGIWLVQSLTRCLAYSHSLRGALRKAYELSAQTGSWLEAPSAIIRLNSDQRLGAEEIMACWHHLGWPLPRYSN